MGEKTARGHKNNRNPTVVLWLFVPTFKTLNRNVALAHLTSVLNLLAAADVISKTAFMLK